MKSPAKLVASIALVATLGGVIAQENPETWHEGLPQQHKSKYLVHDLDRPQPRKVTPGVLSTLPEARTGASMPRVNSSVREISTWSRERTGPSTRTRSMLFRGPTSVTCSSAAN